MSANSKAPEILIKELMAAIRAQFYQGREKEFFQDHRLLLQAVTHPAKVLEKRGAKLPWNQYRGIFLRILGTIRRHGQDTAKIRRISAYLLHAVQEHMKHHWDEYYEESKTVGNALQDAMDTLSLVKRRNRPAPDSTVQDLAALAASLKPRGGRKKVPPIQSGTAEERYLF